MYVTSRHSTPGPGLLMTVCDCKITNYFRNSKKIPVFILFFALCILIQKLKMQNTVQNAKYEILGVVGKKVRPHGWVRPDFYWDVG